MSYLNISQNVCVWGGGWKTIAMATNASHYDLVEWNSPSTVLPTVSLGWSHCLILSSLSSYLITYTGGDRIYSEFSKLEMNQKVQPGPRILSHRCLCVFSLFCFEIKFTGASCESGIIFFPWLQMRENRPGTLLHCWETAQQDFMATDTHSY